jgi:putative addiction module killer protein
MASGAAPFDDWMQDLKDIMGRSAIDARIALLRRGSLGGKHREIGDGLIELKIDWGPVIGSTLRMTGETHSSCVPAVRELRNRT